MPRRFLTLFVLDTALLSLCYYLSFFIYVEAMDLGTYHGLFRATLPLALGAGLGGLLIAGAFRAGTVATGTAEFWNIMKGTLYAAGILMAGTIFMQVSATFPRAIFVLYTGLMPFAAALARLSWRLGERIFPAGPGRDRKRRALVVGAGKTAYAMIEQVKASGGAPFEAVHVVDDNTAKQGGALHGVKIRGSVREIPTAARAGRAEEIVVATDGVDAEEMLRIARYGFRTGLPIRVLPCDEDLDRKRPLYEQLRLLSLVDLVDRGAAEVSPGEIRGAISGKKVLVVGADGVIGRGVALQAARSNPAGLFLFGGSEDDLGALDEELARLYPSISRRVLLGDAANRCRIAEIMAEAGPDVVIHAAPYRSAAIAQENFRDALRANGVAVRAAAEEAAAAGVSLFLHISSDEAGEPVNILGLSMRLGELAVLAVGRGGGETRFASVRVGDVLSESGGVTALWMDQARRGGPIMISHEDAARFYISADRAARLILQAGALAKGGEIFSVGPGKRMKTVDLARLAAVMAGREPGRDMEVRFRSLARGERLVPGSQGETPFSETGRKGVRGSQPPLPPEDFLAGFADLVELINVCDGPREIFMVARELVPEYRPLGRKRI